MSGSSSFLDYSTTVSAEYVDFMELGTGPPATLLLKLSGILSRTNSDPILVLDNACGGGNVTLKLFEALGENTSGVQVICGDSSMGMVDIARNRIEKHGWDAEARGINCLSIPYSSDKFDYVFTNMAFQFLPAPELGLAETHRVLRPGGKSCFTLWQSTGWLAPLQTVAPELVVPPALTSIWVVDEDAMRAKFAELGFTDIATEVIEFDVTFESVKAAIEHLRKTMGPLLENGVGDKLEAHLEEIHGKEPFVCPGWKAIAVTGTVVKG